MNIFNISAKESFVDVLAEYFLKRYEDKQDELSKILFLLPNRRACQNLADAFVRLRGMKPTILPRIEPIADVEEDEIFLSGNKEILQKIKPAVDNTERILLFTGLIMQTPKYGVEAVSLAQAYALAENLASLIDTVQIESDPVQNKELDFSRLKDIVPEDYSEHWQKTLKLLEIITERWPQFLVDNGLCDPMERRKQLLEAELEYWKTSSNRPKIVIAGSTAAFPVLKKAVKTVAEFADGEVYLYGLDKYLDDNAWQKIDENHPQYELKKLLDYLNISRDSVPDLNNGEPSLREKLTGEIMRPAAASDAWRNLSAEMFPKEMFDNIKLVDCDDLRQEAKTIALIMRQTLEEKEKTAALVTADRNLSRRVISELQRWGINADDSAGQPLSLTPIGIYLRLVGEAVIENTMTAKFALMKYPFTACGMKRNEFRRKIEAIEKRLRNSQGNCKINEEQNRLLADFEERLRPLRELYENPAVSLQNMLITHIEVAESLADTNIKTGDKIIWQREDGQVAAKFFAEFIGKSKILDKISKGNGVSLLVAANDYLPFLSAVMTEQNVRLRYGFHPRIKILGSIEARLNHYDTVIIGEMNEGIWPRSPNVDMWMSRPMKDTIGLPPSEKSIGVCAADFAHLLNADKVYLTRAQKVDGAPTDKSRWWLRFETVLEAIFGKKQPDTKEKKDKKEYYAFIYQQPYSSWAKNLESCRTPEAIKPPKPCPKIKYRPRKLSASKVETLMRDPYSIYAEYILKLKALNDLDQKKEACDFGNIVHEMLEEFNDKYNGKEYPDNAAELLMNLGLQKFSENNIGDEVKTFWKPRLKKMIDIVVKHEKECRPEILHIFNEVKGEIEFEGKEGSFYVTGKADRINQNTDGSLCIIDYKTGEGRSSDSIENCISPQLPVEALIAQYAGYKKDCDPPVKVAPGVVSGLQYWALKGKEGALKADKSQNSVRNIKKALQDLIDDFDKESHAYVAKPIQGLQGQYDNYDHLSRFLEWAVRDDKDDDSNGGGKNE